MKLETELHETQAALWPAQGQHILAHYDAETIVVYQAYRPAIGNYVVKHGRFGGEFSFNRMSWIKPNFLWMMYRSSWGKKPDQEVTLGLRIRRAFFETILAQAVASSFHQSHLSDNAEWKAAVADSDVRLQWDPDHAPNGAPLERRAIQLGLRGDTLKAFGQSELLDVIDLSPFVADQRRHLSTGAPLHTPRERVYRPRDEAISKRLRLAEAQAS